MCVCVHMSTCTHVYMHVAVHKPALAPLRHYHECFHDDALDEPPSAGAGGCRAGVALRVSVPGWKGAASGSSSPFPARRWELRLLLSFLAAGRGWLGSRPPAPQGKAKALPEQA